MIKAILFDLDDTLVIERQSAEDSVIELAYIISREVPVDPAEFLDAVFRNARELWHSLPTIDYCKKIAISSWEGLWGDFTDDHPEIRQISCLKNDYRLQTWTRTLNEFGIDKPELAASLVETFPAIRKQKHILYPETIEVLDNLKNNFPLGLITNGAPSLQWEKIRGPGLEKYFDEIFISGEVGIRKPETGIFLTALQKFGINNTETVMVGDRLETDIMGAGNAGITSVWINRTQKVPDQVITPDFTIYDLTGLQEILEKLNNFNA